MLPEPRDYLELAAETIARLIDLLVTHQQATQMQLKYAAFCLGQLGHVESLEYLWNIIEVPEYGVRTACAASIAAIATLPASTGASQADRRQLIHDIYHSNPRVGRHAKEFVRRMAKLASGE